MQKKKMPFRVVTIALAVTLLQIFIVLTFNEQRDLTTRYTSLSQWDSHWFANITSSGYYVRPQAKDIQYTNTVFPPGLPALSFVVKKVTGFNARTSTILTSQIATFLFWIYFLLLARRLKTSPSFTAVGVLSVLLYPAAFFFVVGYSDSLFLAMLLGMLFWQNDRRQYSWLVAGIHGCIMTATRIVGIPLIVLPLVHTVFTKGFRGLSNPRPWITTILSGAGAGAFFLFCRLVFGEWFLQVRAHQYWATKPDIGAILNPIFYRFWKPFYIDGVLHPDYLSIMSFQILLAFIITAMSLDIFTYMKHKHFGTFAIRMSLYTTALLTWAFTLTARSHNVSGAFRYMIVPAVLCILGLMGWSAAMDSKKMLPRIVFWVLTLLLSTTITMQMAYIGRYTHRLWVA